MKARKFTCEGCAHKCKLEINLGINELPRFCLMNAPNYSSIYHELKWRRTRRGTNEGQK